MRSVLARFNELQQKRPELSSYTNFAGAIKGQGFTRPIISKWFNKFVNKSDYEPRDRNRLIEGLVKLSQKPEENDYES